MTAGFGTAEGGPTRLQLGVLLLLGVLGALLLGILLYPFFPALVISAVLATLFFPAHRWVRQAVRQKDIAALISTTAVFFLVLVPAVLLSLVLIDNIREGVEWLRTTVEDATAPGGFLTRVAEGLTVRLGLEGEELTRQATDELSRLLGMLARRTFTFLSGIGGVLLQASAALFTLFYFLRDGDRLMETVKWVIPLDPETTERLVTRTRDVIFATVWGNVAVAIVQGTLGGLAFWVVGLPAAALWGTVMGILSLLPVVGPMMVWLPAGLILLGQGEILRGVLLFALGGGIVSTIDNYLRAVIIGERAELHPLVVFFAVLGGLFVFGAVGIFVGPVVFVIAFTMIELARAAMESVDEDRRAPRTAGPPGGDVLAGGAMFRDAGTGAREREAREVPGPGETVGARGGGKPDPVSAPERDAAGSG